MPIRRHDDTPTLASKRQSKVDAIRPHSRAKDPASVAVRAHLITKKGRRSTLKATKQGAKKIKKALNASKGAILKQRSINRRENKLNPKPIPPPLPANLGCEHPKTRALGICRNVAVGEFTIPTTYTPTIRHTHQLSLPRDRPVRLCALHIALVQLHENNQTPGPDFAHRAQCGVCNHPHGERVVGLWVKWLYNTKEAVTELGVTDTAFNNHIHYYGLDEKKAERSNRKRGLIRVAELGLAMHDHSVRTGLEAMKQLADVQGDAKNINVQAVVGTFDLASASDEELAQAADSIAKQLRSTKSTGPVPVEAEVVRDQADVEE